MASAGCGGNVSIYRSRDAPPPDANCVAAGSASWQASCGRLDTTARLPFGPERVFDKKGLAPTWAGDDIGWTCGSFVSSAWQDGWNLTYPGGHAAAATYNTVKLFSDRGLKILRNVETPFDAMKAGSGDPLTRRPDLGATILAWEASAAAGVTRMDRFIAAFREQLAAPTDGFWYDEEWVVGNLTRFPLSSADREVARAFVAQGWMNSSTLDELNDTTVASLRPPGAGQTGYYQVSVSEQMMIACDSNPFDCACRPYLTDCLLLIGCDYPTSSAACRLRSSHKCTSMFAAINSHPARKQCRTQLTRGRCSVKA